MNISNADMVLLALSSLKEKTKNNKISYRELELNFNQSRSQISQALIKNEEKGYIEKEKDHPRFDTIIINENGISQAEKLKKAYNKYFIATKTTITATTKTKPKEKQEKQPDISTKKTQKIPPETNENFFNNFIDKIQLQLQKEVESILLDYIPQNRLDNDLINDLVDSTQDFIYTELINFFRDFKISR